MFFVDGIAVRTDPAFLKAEIALKDHDGPQDLRELAEPDEVRNHQTLASFLDDDGIEYATSMRIEIATELTWIYKGDKTAEIMHPVGPPETNGYH